MGLQLVRQECDLRKYDHITDDEEWFVLVLSRHQPEPSDGDDDWYWEPPNQPSSSCPECGATGACGYDQDGRPMIHSLHDTGRTL